jgi:outer membrane protein assembly factor BamB
MTTIESTPTPRTSLQQLQEALRQGLTVISEVWSYSAKDWVTSVHVADIDGDGDDEVLLGSRDGSVKALTRQGLPKWEYMAQQGEWLGTIYCINNVDALDRTRVLVGARDFRVIALDELGSKIWEYRTDQVVRRIRVGDINRDGKAEVLVGSEDCCVHALECETGKPLWKYKTNGWIRFALPIDLDGDEEIEILAASGDRHLYILNHQGKLKRKFSTGSKIHALHATDLDGDGIVEILIGSDAKDLCAMTPEGDIKWRFAPDNRIHSISTVDLNDDGLPEVVAGSEDGHIYFLNSQGELLWKHFLGQRIFSTYPADLNGDGSPEILAGSDDNHIHVLRVEVVDDLLAKILYIYEELGRPDLATLNFSHRERELLRDMLYETRPYVSRLTVAQVEDFLALQDYKSALSALLRLDRQDVQLLWTKTDIGHVRDISLNMVTEVTERELAICTDEGDLKILDGRGNTRWTHHFDEQLRTVRVADVDQDGIAEVIVGDKDGHVTVLSSQGDHQIKWQSQFEDWIESIWTTEVDDGQDIEIVFSSANHQIHICGSNFQPILPPIITPPSVVVVAVITHDLNGDGIQEILTGALDHKVRVYTREGQVLWTFETHDRVKDIRVIDIDNDGHVEVLVGSEDRNIYALDHMGKMKWRYQTPHRVMSITALDANHDGQVEIFVGSGNGTLYVLNGQGDVLWQFKANDRIRRIHVADLNGDGTTEILLGTEDRLYMLQALDHQLLRQYMEICWQALLKQSSPANVLSELARHADTKYRAFALTRLLSLPSTDDKDRDLVSIDRLLTEDTPEIKQVIAESIPAIFRLRTENARTLIESVATYIDNDTRIKFINNLPALCSYDPRLGFEYLDRFSRSMNPWIRREVVRKLDQIFRDFPQETFPVLLNNFQLNNFQYAAQWKNEWLDQEMIRVLAHYFDAYPETLLRGIRLLIINEVEQPLLGLAVHCATTPLVRNIFQVFGTLLSDLSNDNIRERLRETLIALAQTRSLPYGEFLYRLHQEFFDLHYMRTIEEIAQYKCIIVEKQVMTEDDQKLHFQYTLRALHRLNTIASILRTYLRREGLGDRITSLLEATTTIDAAVSELKGSYFSWCNHHEHFPDYNILKLLLTRWYGIVKVELGRLQGKSELYPELQTRIVPQEDQVGVLLSITNKGRSPADNVTVILKPDDAFLMTTENRHKFETISTQEPVLAEFTIRPYPYLSSLHLTFEITYDDAEAKAKTISYGNRLDLVERKREFQPFQNPYYTGTPVQDQHMFYGREEEFAFLQEDFVHSSANTVVVLYGQRRSGKSSLLYQLLQRPILSPHIPVRIDMQHETLNFSTGKFLRSLAINIHKELRKHAIALRQPQKTDFDEDPILALDMFLDDVEAVLGERKIVILIDEFEILEDKVKKNELDADIFDYLRSLMQHWRCIHFLLAGTHTIKELTAEYWSVFFNIAIHRRLAKFAKKAAEQLITEPVAEKLEYDPFAIEKIHQLTGDQPYLIQLVCHSLVRHCNKEQKNYVTINDVNIVQEKVMETGRIYFDWIWNQTSTKEERIVLAIIAQGGGDDGRNVSLADIERAHHDYGIPYRREMVLQALRKLCSGDVVSEAPRENRFKLPVGLTRIWLFEEKKLQDVIMEENYIFPR